MTLKKIAALALTTWALAAQAGEPPLDIRLSYTVTTAGNLPEITSILTFNSYADGGGGVWWSASVPGQTLSWTITDPFLKSSANPPVDALMVGLVQDLPGDAPGQKHVVLMMSSAAAQAATNIAWGTLFRNTLEEQLIADIELATSGLPIEAIEPALNNLFDFAGGDARGGILGPGGVPIDAWFTVAGVQPGSVTSAGFKVMAFSTGQLIGEGTAFTDAVAVVPEPQAWAMWLAGLSALGFVARRRAG
jgi:hypothetical protein